MGSDEGISSREDGNRIVTIPRGVLRDVLAHDRARELLLLLARQEGPLRYSRAREALGLRPSEFQRALNRLERHALVGFRAPADLSRPRAERAYVVLLELTAAGEFFAQLWARMEKLSSNLARRHGLDEEALESLSAGA